MGWDSNGTPCLINANKPVSSSLGNPIGYTTSPYITGADDRFQPFKLAETTNPYLSSSSSFPTFTPPILPPPLPFPVPQITPEASVFRNSLLKNYAQDTGPLLRAIPHPVQGSTRVACAVC